MNLFLYGLGYFFAVLVTYNVFCVINGNYHQFMRKALLNKQFLLFLSVMLTVYLVPLILLYANDDFNNYSYSYGPTGFNYPT